MGNVLYDAVVKPYSNLANLVIKMAAFSIFKCTHVSALKTPNCEFLFHCCSDLSRFVHSLKILTKNVVFDSIVIAIEPSGSEIVRSVATLKHRYDQSSTNEHNCVLLKEVVLNTRYI